MSSNMYIQRDRVFIFAGSTHPSCSRGGAEHGDDWVERGHTLASVTPGTADNPVIIT